VALLVDRLQAVPDAEPVQKARGVLPTDVDDRLIVVVQADASEPARVVLGHELPELRVADLADAEIERAAQLHAAQHLVRAPALLAPGRAHRELPGRYQRQFLAEARLDRPRIASACRVVERLELEAARLRE